MPLCDFNFLKKTFKQSHINARGDSHDSSGGVGPSTGWIPGSVMCHSITGLDT